MKKKSLKKYIAWILLAALVAGLSVMPMLAAKEEEEEGPKASILTATVATENLEVSLEGGGTLSAGSAMDVKIPTGVKITRFLVDNGDMVREGDAVAKVDTVSVMNAIVEVRKSMDSVQKNISNAKNDKVSASIRAAAGGRVKQVFASPGDSVVDVMLEHGALAVLSLDGRMAVSLERKTDLGAGDTVLVKIGEQEVPGRVESNLNGKLVVTVEDKSYAVGAKVTLTTEDGDRLGAGELYVHNAWIATGYSGTVNQVQVKVDTTVYEGNTLFTLKDTEFTGNLDHYSNLHREYEELLQDLFIMYETEVLTAPCDGMVSGVDEDSAFLLSAMDAEDGWYVDLLTGEESGETGWTVMLLSSTQAVTCTGKDVEGKCKAEVHKEGCAMYCTGKASCISVKGKKHDAMCLSFCSSEEETGKCIALNHKASCVEKCSNAKETGKCSATKHHKPGCIESCLSTDGKTNCPATGAHKKDCLMACDKTEKCTAEKHHYEECLTRCTGTADCPALNHKDSCVLTKYTYKAYAGKVRQIGSSELIVVMDTETVYQLKNGKKGLELVSPTSVKTELMLTEQVVTVANPAGFRAGDVVLFWVAYSGEKEVASGATVYKAASGSSVPGMGGMNGMAGISGFGGMSGMSGKGGMVIGGGSASTQQELFSLEGEVLMTVTDHSAMKLEITLDEQDITQVKIGQTAQVKVTAIRGEIFEAEVTDIGMEGTGNGGSSKFTVELTLPWHTDLLDGMSATAVIPMYTKMQVLTVPLASLVEQKDGTVIYTAQDPKTGELTAPVKVVTGVADAERVEILEGLKSGDTVYYSYYDTLELDHTAKAERGGLF